MGKTKFENVVWKKLSDRYRELNWTILFYNRECDFENSVRIAAMNEQNAIVRKFLITFSRTATDVINYDEATSFYVGRAAYHLSYDDATVRRGIIAKKKNKFVIDFGDAHAPLGSIVYIAD
jgi:hypothetical protein